VDLCAYAGQGGPDLPSRRGGGPVPPLASGEAAAKASTATCPVAASLPREVGPTTTLLNAVVRVRVLETGHGLPTDTLGTYVDITVSPPVTEAARRIIALRARARGV
jgi:hypothetical protein